MASLSLWPTAELLSQSSDGGVVINMSSPAAVGTDLAGTGAYSATKAAIDNLSRAAAVEWAGDGIRVNTLMPIARTPAVQASLDMYPGLEERLIADIPLQRIGDPETDIGPAAVFLAGPRVSTSPVRLSPSISAQSG